MSLKQCVGPAFDAVRRRPFLVVVGFVLALLQVTAGAVGLIVGTSAGPILGGYLGPTLSALSAWLVVPLYAAVYVPAREPPESAIPTLRRAATACRRHYVPLFRALLFAQAVAVCVGVIATLSAFILITGVQFVRYALADPAPPFPTEFAIILLVTFFVGYTAGLVAVRFYDATALFGDARPAEAWRASARAVVRRPVSVLGYAFLAVLLASAPLIVVRAASSGASGTLPSRPIVTVLAYATVAGATLTLSLVLHVEVYDRVVAPELDGWTETVSSTSASVDRRAVVFAVLLVVAGAGTGVLRAADARPDGGREAVPLSDDPRSAYVTAVRNTADANHRWTLYTHNLSDPDAELRPFMEGGVDYDDRQRYNYFHDDGKRVGSYFSEGTLATYRAGGRNEFGFLERQFGDWRVIAAPGYYLVMSGERLFQVNALVASTDWTIVDRNESTLTLRLDDPEDVRAVLTDSYAGMGGNMTDNSHLTVYADRERGVLNRVVFRLHSRDTGRDFRYVVRYREVGTANLRRPAAIGQRRPLEWAWDLLHY